MAFGGMNGEMMRMLLLVVVVSGIHAADGAGVTIPICANPALLVLCYTRQRHSVFSDQEDDSLGPDRTFDRSASDAALTCSVQS